MTLDRPELTQQALGILRDPSTFEWHFIPIFAFVVYIYFNEIERKNWKGIAAGLSLYMVHWAFEIGNALIQHFWGHALWTVPGRTSFLLLVGVGWEISMMFAVAGLIMSKILPEDPKMKILGLNNRIGFVVGNAAFFGIFEIFLARTPGFHWVFPWWGAFPVFLTVYIPFFMAAALAYDARLKASFTWIGGLFAVNAAMLIVFAGVLGWI